MKGWTSEAIARSGISGNLEKSHQTHGNGPSWRYRYYVGIDAGVNTGTAVYDRSARSLITVQTTPIHVAMIYIKDFWDYRHLDMNVLVRVEDARLRKWIPPEHNEKAERGRREGAGAVKRDAKIWEDYLTYLGMPFEMVAPKDNATKLTDERFRNMTGWKGRTNEHGRDSAMLVYGF